MCMPWRPRYDMCICRYHMAIKLEKNNYIQNVYKESQFYENGAE